MGCGKAVTKALPRPGRGKAWVQGGAAGSYSLQQAACTGKGRPPRRSRMVRTKYGCVCKPHTSLATPQGSHRWAGCGDDVNWCDVEPGCPSARDAGEGYAGWDECSRPENEPVSSPAAKPPVPDSGGQLRPEHEPEPEYQSRARVIGNSRASERERVPRLGARRGESYAEAQAMDLAGYSPPRMPRLGARRGESYAEEHVAEEDVLLFGKGEVNVLNALKERNTALSGSGRQYLIRCAGEQCGALIRPADLYDEEDDPVTPSFMSILGAVRARAEVQDQVEGVQHARVSAEKHYAGRIAAFEEQRGRTAEERATAAAARAARARARQLEATLQATEAKRMAEIRAAAIGESLQGATENMQATVIKREDPTPAQVNNARTGSTNETPGMMSTWMPALGSGALGGADAQVVVLLGVLGAILVLFMLHWVTCIALSARSGSPEEKRAQHRRHKKRR